MTVRFRPRRSVLFMPGSNARALAKARSLGADALIFDLEDAVAPAEKDRARNQIAATLKAAGYGHRELVVRINGLMTPWGADDIRMMADVAPDAVLVPKVENKQVVDAVDSRMRQAGLPETVAIWCMVETPKGVLHAEEIASASHRVGALVMGTSDLAKDMHALHTPGRLPFVTALSWCILAARAHGLAILDGVHLAVDDDVGFREACRQGREFGFDGKTLIHPKTIAVANEMFAPERAEIEWSHRVIAAHEAARHEGKGVVLLDGLLIENLHVENAQRVVQLAEMIEAVEGCTSG